MSQPTIYLYNHITHIGIAIFKTEGVGEQMVKYRTDENGRECERKVLAEMRDYSMGACVRNGVPLPKSVRHLADTLSY